MSYNEGDYYRSGNGYKVWNGERFVWKGRNKGSGKEVPNPNNSEDSSTTDEDSGVSEPTGDIRYPRDFNVDTSGIEYVKFTFWKYKEGKGQLGQTGSLGSDNYYTDESIYEPAGGLPGLIVVNMPQDINTQFGAQWGGKQFGFLSKNIVKAGGDLSQGNFGGTFDALGKLVQGAMDRGDAVKAVAAAAIVAGINKIPGVGGNLTMNDIVQGSASKVLNPNVELMYEGPSLRTLSMNMKLFARTSSEAEDIKNIGKAFRKAAVPSSKNNRFMKVPPLLKVQFMKGSVDNVNLPMYRRFAITAVQVNYTPDGQYTPYYDGKLPAIDIALELQETKIIFAEDVDQGF